MPVKIQEVTTSQKLIRKFALVGQITPQLDETIVPVVVLEDLSDTEEWEHAFIHDDRVGVALEYNSWSLENPVGSGKVLQLIEAHLTAPTTVQFVAVANDVTPSLNTLLDAQLEELHQIVLAADRFPAGEARRQGLLALFGGPEVWGGFVLGNSEVNWRPARTLLYPGVRLFFQQQVVDQRGTLSLEWRERKLRPDGS